MIRTKTLLAVALAALAAMAAAALPGCRSYPNRHGRQALPHAIRIVTVPAGAELRVVPENLVLTTPADVTFDLKHGAALVITKEGYRPFRGTLQDMQQIALDTYRVTLHKAGR